MTRYVWAATFCLGLMPSVSLGQDQQSEGPVFGYVPADSSPPIWDVGCGLGLPYGVMGGKLALGAKPVKGEVGLGVVPLVWSAAYSAGGTLSFAGQYSTVRPKITFVCSNAAAIIVFLEEGDLDPIYDEVFPGFGIYAGIDWRLGKTIPFCVDLNVGWVSAFKGNDEVERRFYEVRDDLEDQGYEMGETKINMNAPKISFGITYSPQRPLRFIRY